MDTIWNMLLIAHELRWWIAGIAWALLIIAVWFESAPMEPEDETWG